jgi:hypothetical protein
MDIKELFLDIHGTSDVDIWQPLAENPEIDTETLAVYLEVDVNHLWEDKSSLLNRYLYFDGLYLWKLDSVDINVLESISKMRSKLSNLTLGKQIRESAAYFKHVKDVEKDFPKLFGMIDKKVLFWVFNNIFDQIPLEQQWEAYHEAHIRAETGFDKVHEDIMQYLLTTSVYKSKERRTRLRKLKKVVGDDTFTIYHGHNKGYNPKDDISWTLDYGVSQFFANRFGNNGEISTKTIKYKDVLDYFNDRNEHEIILKLK